MCVFPFDPSRGGKMRCGVKVHGCEGSVYRDAEKGRLLIKRDFVKTVDSHTFKTNE